MRSRIARLLLLSVLAVAAASVLPAAGTQGSDQPAHEAGLHEGAGQEEATGHQDPVMPVLVAVAVILLGAKLGGELFERIKQPAVLGELLAGVVIGNIDFVFHIGIFEAFRSGPTHELLLVFGGLGAVFLLFGVGLETSISQMMKVGLPATLVGIAGVVAPWLLGFGVGVYFIPDDSFAAHLFIGAILTATSVGITARVYKDLGRLNTNEARVILGAAVIDDILGLIILSVVSGMVIQGAVGIMDILKITFLSAAFLAGAVLLGSKFASYVSRYLGVFMVDGMKLITAVSFCFGLAWLSGKIGLAPIVGAFAAGLILDEQVFAPFKREKPLHDLLQPFSTFFVPIFFVLMGIDVHLEAFANPEVLGLALGITVAAIIGKQVCGLVVYQKGLDRISIGLGMIPRGEVGLIFASIGRALGVVDDNLYAACVIMVIITTFIAPIAIQMRIKAQGKRAAAS